LERKGSKFDKTESLITRELPEFPSLVLKKENQGVLILNQEFTLKRV